MAIKEEIVRNMSEEEVRAVVGRASWGASGDERYSYAA